MTHKRGSTPANVRDTNIKLIMQLLYHSDCSRTELAEKNELSNPALTKIVGELIGLGFVFYFDLFYRLWLMNIAKKKIMFMALKPMKFFLKLMVI